MNRLILLAAVAFGDWTYAGFCDDPKPSPRSTVAACGDACACGGVKNPIRCGEVCLCAPTVETRPTARPVARPEPPPPPAPKPEPPSIDHYEGVDAAGQRWRCNDPDRLREFLRDRNAALGRSRATAPPPPAYCPPGRS